MSQPAITVRGLTKRYGTTVAVDDLGFEVTRGTVTAFLGPNGAGKTTTMRVLLGLAPADAGEALVLGQQYRALDRPARRIGTLAETADEVVVVNRGSLVTHTSVEDLTAGRTVSVSTSDCDRLRRALAAKGARLQLTGPDALAVAGLTEEEVGTVAAGEGVIVYELTGRAERLEDVFLGLVQEGDHRVAS